MKVQYNDGTISVISGDISISGLRFGVVYSKGSDQLLHAAFDISPAFEKQTEFLESNSDVSVNLFIKEKTEDTVEISAKVQNVSGDSIKLWTINLLEGAGPDGELIALAGGTEEYRFYTYNDEFHSKIDKLDGEKPPFNRQFTETWAGMDVFWPRPADIIYDSAGWCVSRDFGGLFSVSAQMGLFAGFTGPGNAFGDICVKKQGGIDGFCLRSRMDGVLMDPGEIRFSETAMLILACPIDAAARWADAAAVGMGGARASHVLSGWCTWYQYWGGISEADVGKAIDEYEKLPSKVDVLQIDDGYQQMWGQWAPNCRFPSGMKAVSEKMRSAGFIPGVYLAPIAVHVDSLICKQHPDWLQRLPDGCPAITFNKGTHVYLDPTNPNVQAYIAETVRMQTQDWGYDYIKYDFTYPLAIGVALHNQKMTTFQMHREVYRIIREAAGEDKYLMACVGEPGRYAIGYADAARIGPDSSIRWPAMKDALQCVILRTNVNHRWFVSDPDVFFLRSEKCDLNHEERLFTAIVMAMSGGLAMTSDLPSQWDSEAMAVFLKTTDKSWECARPILLPGDGLPEVMFMHHKSETIAALLNWADEEKDISVELSAIGLNSQSEYALFDFWAGTPATVCAHTLSSLAQPPHSARVFRGFEEIRG